VFQLQERRDFATCLPDGLESVPGRDRHAERQTPEHQDMDQDRITIANTRYTAISQLAVARKNWLFKKSYRMRTSISIPAFSLFNFNPEPEVGKLAYRIAWQLRQLRPTKLN